MGIVGSNDVVARSSRPSLSKSSMTAPPAMLNRLTFARWPMSRNFPMSNSDLRNGSIEIQVPRIDLRRVFAQRHVGHVQQPADILIVRKLLQILGEMPDRQAGAGRIGCARPPAQSAGCTSSRPGTSRSYPSRRGAMPSPPGNRSACKEPCRQSHPRSATQSRVCSRSS